MRRLSLPTRHRYRSTASFTYKPTITTTTLSCHQTHPITPPYTRSLAQIKTGTQCFTNTGSSSQLPLLSHLSFSSSSSSSSSSDHVPPDARTLKLGHTIRVLHARLPSLLATPLPPDILAPAISLRLFPSTHPHLPSVSGRLAYTAALWTSPVAWGRMPVLGRVALEILSERMVRLGGAGVGVGSGVGSGGDEKLVVRWRSCGRSSVKVAGKVREVLGNGQGHSVDDKKEFEGLFIFEFDGEGRISSHTIENVEQGNNLEKTASIIDITDWLLRKAKGNDPDPDHVPGLAFCALRNRRNPGER